MKDRIPDDPRIAHGGGQDDVDCPECDGEGKDHLSQCCGAFLENDGDFCPECKERSMLAVCVECGGSGARSRESLRAEAREARAEYLADLRRDEDQDR